MVVNREDERRNHRTGTWVQCLQDSGTEVNRELSRDMKSAVEILGRHLNVGRIESLGA